MDEIKYIISDAEFWTSGLFPDSEFGHNCIRVRLRPLDGDTLTAYLPTTAAKRVHGIMTTGQWVAFAMAPGGKGGFDTIDVI